MKNNLQTVAALLRMQARRIASPEAKVALNDAMSRVSSIAIVHETLSQAFDEIVEFDRVADGLLRMVGDVAASWGGVSAVRQGSFGLLSADVATSLAMIITELCQNAVEHGLADRARARSGWCRPRLDGRLRVEISDDGRGLPTGLRLADVAQPGPVHRHHPGRRDGGRRSELGSQPDGPGPGPWWKSRSEPAADVGDGQPAAWSLTSQGHRIRCADCLPQCRGVGRMSVRRTVTALLAAGLAVAVAIVPAVTLAGAGPTTGSGSPARERPRLPPAAVRRQQRLDGASTRCAAPVTDENFYFVMADRFENGSTANDTGGIAGGRLAHGFDPTNKGFYNGGDLEGTAGQDRLHPGSRHDLDLAHPELQEQGGAAGGRPVSRLPRLLGHRLHPDRPAPGHQRGASRRWSTPPMTAA